MKPGIFVAAALGVIGLLSARPARVERVEAAVDVPRGIHPPDDVDPTPPAVQGAVSLGAAPVEVRVALSPRARRALAERGREVALAVDDVRLAGPPEVYYELYVNLPARARDTVYTGPHYVGNLSFYGPSPQSHAFSLGRVHARLRALRRWRDDAVRVTFVPRAYVEGENAARTLRRRTQAVVGRVTIRVE